MIVTVTQVMIVNAAITQFLVKSIQETMNAINTNISFDENTGTMMKLYFFIKELRRVEPNRLPCLREVSKNPSKESKT